MSTERRSPTMIQRLNNWLLPIMSVTLLGIAGFYGNKTWTAHEILITVVANQAAVMKGQQEMKESIEEVKNIATGVSAQMELHLQASGLSTKSNSRLHHRGDIAPCNGCHNK